MWLLLNAMVFARMLWAEEVLFQDDFKGQLGSGWSWMREHREAWRVTERGLEVRIEPGNMWGPQNSARNLLVRPGPDSTTSEIEISVNVENHRVFPSRLEIRWPLHPSLNPAPVEALVPDHLRPRDFEIRE